jgi:putative ABC transport system permease protein
MGDWSDRAMTSLLHDLRYGARLLVRSPVFGVVAILTLAIGIGANTAIFSVVNTLLLQPLPYADAERLAIVWEHNLVRGNRSNVVGPSNYLHWRDMNRSFEELAAFSFPYSITLTSGGEPEVVQARSTSVELFGVLGVRPALGRDFTRDEGQPGSRVAIISDRLWKRRFGGDPAIVGKAVEAQGVSYTVAGVMPPGFTFMESDIDVWVPLGFAAADRSRRGRSIFVAGRLKPGVTIEAAQADMTEVSRQLTELRPDFNTGWSSRVVGLRDQLTGDVRAALFVLAGAVAFVLLIACANVANLLLARATGRQRELAVRAALGAGRTRLVRQLLAESVLLAAIGGACGLLLAWWSLQFLRTVVAARVGIPRLDVVGIDAAVLIFTAAVTLLCGAIFGAVPALSAAGPNLTGWLKEGGRSGSGARGTRARSVFVVVEIALALMLLVGAGLLVRSFVRLLDQRPGFETGRTVTMRVSLPGSRYGGEGQRAQFFKRLFEQIDSLPGVEAAGGVSFLPLTGLGAATSMRIVGQPEPAPGQEPVTDVRVMTHDYLAAMRIPLLSGRLFDEADKTDTTNRIVINETMARRHWPGQDPIGRRVRISWDDREDEIIGVVGDVKHAGLDAEPRAMIYWPFARNPYGTMTLTVRTSSEGLNPAPAIAAIVRSLDPELVVAGVKTMDEVVADSVAQRRLTMLLLTVFAAAALLLAAIGIYGVIAYGVTQRLREIGIRMALGAQRGAVLAMIVRQALALAAAGIVIGGAGAVLLGRVMEGLLFQIRPSDPLTFAGVSGLLAAVALRASYIRGRRATLIDPVIALRSE